MGGGNRHYRRAEAAPAWRGVARPGPGEPLPVGQGVLGPGRPRFNPSGVGTYCRCPGTARGGLRGAVCQPGPAPRWPHCTPRWPLGWQQLPEGRKAFISPHLQTPRLEHLSCFYFPSGALGCSRTSSAPELALRSRAPLLPHGSISRCLAPAHPTHGHIPNTGCPETLPWGGDGVRWVGEGAQEPGGLWDPSGGQDTTEPISAAGRRRASPAPPSGKSHC